MYEDIYQKESEPKSYRFQEYQETSQEPNNLFENETYDQAKKPKKSLNPIVHMNLKNKFFIQNITETQMFCIDRLPKTFEKIWSSASVIKKIITRAIKTQILTNCFISVSQVKIRSTKPCVVSDGTSLSDLVNRNDLTAS